ncbi:MAG TPA: hypothetical protein VFI17_09275 [Solirubrobacterales bacterium]|nr:hypothetical protein [Solirubrobacterales bacterium]
MGADRLGGSFMPVEASPPPQGQLRDAYVPSRRVRLASDVAGLCAVGLLIGLLGSGLTWWDRSDLFDLASNSRQTVKMGLGYLAGPILILVTLPLVLGSARQVALKHYFRARLALAAVLWLAGLAILVAKVTDLDGYTVEAGTYVAAGLLVLGFVATLAMWPWGLRMVRVDRNGMVRAATAAAARPARSPTGP